VIPARLNSYDQHLEVNMGLGLDLLSLRRSQTSTMSLLLAGIERLATARTEVKFMSRAFELTEMGDAVLAKVAVYALEAYWGDQPIRKARRSAVGAARARVFRPSPGQFNQRRLFA
jgi:hypothetical protein